MLGFTFGRNCELKNSFKKVKNYLRAVHFGLFMEGKKYLFASAFKKKERKGEKKLKLLETMSAQLVFFPV